MVLAFELALLDVTDQWLTLVLYCKVYLLSLFGIYMCVLVGFCTIDEAINVQQ